MKSPSVGCAPSSSISALIGDRPLRASYSIVRSSIGWHRAVSTAASPLSLRNSPPGSPRTRISTVASTAVFPIRSTGGGETAGVKRADWQRTAHVPSARKRRTRQAHRELRLPQSLPQNRRTMAVSHGRSTTRIRRLTPRTDPGGPPRTYPSPILDQVVGVRVPAPQPMRNGLGKPKTGVAGDDAGHPRSVSTPIATPKRAGAPQRRRAADYPVAVRIASMSAAASSWAAGMTWLYRSIVVAI